MKSRKKIWSIPIAALALVLMLAGALVVSGMVQAQSAKEGKRGFSSAPGTDIIQVLDLDDVNKETLTLYLDPNADNFGAASTIATVAIFAVDLDNDVQTVDDNRPGLVTPEAYTDLHSEAGDDGKDFPSVELTGTDAGKFAIDSTTREITVTERALSDFQAHNKQAVYTFDVKLYVDLDEGEDSGNGAGKPSDAKNAVADVQEARDGDVSDDQDEVETLSVTIHALKITTDNFAFATTRDAVSDAALMGLDDEGAGFAHSLSIAGLPGKAAVTVPADDDADWQYVVNGDRTVSLKHESAPGVTTGKAAGTIDQYDSSLMVDIDGAVTDPNNDTIVLNADSTIKIFGDLRFLKSRAGPTDTPAEVPFTDDNLPDFSVQSNAEKGTAVGEVALDGAFPNTVDLDQDDEDDGEPVETDESEEIDVIVTGSSAFSVRVRKSEGVATTGVGAEVEAAVIMVNGTLDMADSPYEFYITANGRLGSTRTDSVKVTVMVNASNDPPVVSGIGSDDKLSLMIKETYKKTDDNEDINILVKGLVNEGEDDEEPNDIYDLSQNATDPNGNSLTFEVVSGSGFEIRSGSSWLVPSSDISVQRFGLEDDEERPDDDTTKADESKVYYEASDGVFSNGEDKTNVANDDLTFELRVAVRDSANTEYIDVVLTLEANDSVQAVTEADDLPAAPFAVTFEMVDRDTDDDDETDDVATPTYKVSVELSERDVPATILKLDDIMTDGDGDERDYEVVSDNRPPHIVIDSSGATNGHVLITYLPPDALAGRTDLIKVTADDDFNSAEDAEGEAVPDQTFYVEISLTELPPEPIDSRFIGITVEENSRTCALTDGGGACTVGGIIGSGESYKLENGVDIGPADARNYAVDASTGEITVVNAPDFEDDLNPAFIVEVRDDLGEVAGLISVRVTVTDVDEEPSITTTIGTAWVYESAQVGDAVLNKVLAEADPSPSDPPISIAADDPEGAAITYSIIASKAPFAIDASTGALTVSGALDRETAASHAFTVNAADPAGNSDVMEITVMVLNSNETPNFTSPTGDGAVTTIPENTPNAHVIFTFTATDQDGDDLTFTLREGQSRDLFVIQSAKSEIVGDEEVWSGELHVKTDVILDFEDAGYDPRVHVEANDPEGLNATLLLTVNLSNVNDNDPVFDTLPAATSLSVPENTARGFVLANYSASDADGDSVSYSLSGTDAKSFTISGTGDLMTLESLDADRNVPCGTDGCAIDVVASDGERSVSASVRISVTAIEDSVSTLGVTKANPVPGTESGHPMSALAGVKTGGDEYLWNLLDCAGMLELVDSTDEAAYCKMWDGLSAEAKAKVSAALTSEAPAESPYHLPASYGSAPVNFVETEWANWGTIVRIEVTAESPSATCGNGNQCVVIDVNSDSADTSIKLQAYRTGTQENKFVAALMLVELSENATDSTDAGVYQHTDGGVAALKVDEEDEIEIEFGNLRGSLDVENEDPEISNFAPEHEAAFDDADVDYTFTVTDSNSGMPEPEDLPDVDGDADYTPVVALISGGQCETHAGDADTVKTDGGTLSMAASINDDESLYCPGTAQDGEYDASVGSTFGFAPIRDDRDFKEIDDGFDVETTIVLRENKTYFVTFIACDNAGNCSFYDPDGNDDAEELAQITVDTEDPVFVEARTGLTWDSTDNEYDDNRSFIQVIFNDLTTLNTATVEIDDFVVEGHTISDVHIFENPDDDDVDWADSGRYADPSSMNLRKIDRYRDLENVVFIELADELLADETPDVTIVPNGVEDSAGNEQDDGDHEADDWISPEFTIVSIVSTRETSQDEILAGDDDEVTVVVTTDERLDSTRPTVTVTYVNAPAGSIDTKGTALCDTDDGDDKGTRERGEIVSNGDCVDSGAATGGNLNNSVEKVSNTEWIVTITEPKDTGYYNFRISGKDRSPQENPGSEGVSPSSIVTDFFDADGDVNADDAIFFEGDINLPKPEVRVSGVGVQDNEADVEFRSPLFVELDFARNHAICGANADTDERMANCTNENSEYAEDNFDDVVVTSFVLDGVDLTDSVKTTDNQSFLVSLESISIGDHTAEVQAVDQAGNVFEDTLEIDFEVNDRDPFEKRLSPGWNLVSLPGEPADSSIASVFGPGVEVRTVYSYDPVIPGGWQVAVRETLDSDWQGDLTEITGQRGYWVLSDAIQDWEVIIPRLAGGASGTGTPIQPPVIPMYAGWNLIPVTDVSGNALSANIEISAEAYLNSLDDGLDLARVLGYDTIRNEWFTVLDKQMGMVVNANLRIGAGYWVFVREAAALVPGGIAGVSGGD